MEHGCFNFQEVVLHHEVTNSAHCFAARHKTGARTLVHHQIHIALAVLNLLVIDAMKLVRHGPQTLGEHADAARMNRQLARTGFKQLTLAGNDVAEVPVLEISIEFFAHVIAHDINLDTPSAVLQSGKTCLAHQTFKHHPACYFGELAFIF